MSEQNDLDALREYLATRDAACPSCGYNLRGLTSDHCPECHQEIALRVSLVDPRLALFLAGVVAWALGTGFSALLLLYGVIVLIRFGTFGPNDLFFRILAISGLIQGGVLVCLLGYNRRVRRWSTRSRLLVAVSGFAASFANVLIFGLNIR